MAECIPVHHHTGHSLKFVLPVLMYMMLMSPNLCLAGTGDAQFMSDNTLISTMNVQGTTGVVYWSSPVIAYTKDVKVESFIINNTSGSSWLPVSGLRIVNNCSFEYTTEDGKTNNVVVTLKGVKTNNRYYLPEPARIVSYAMSCRATLTNESHSNIVMDGRYVFYVDFHYGNSNQFIINGQISTGTLYTTPSCTLSVPDPNIQFTGDATSFINGIQRSASFSASCEGTASATLSLSGTGAIDTEGCLSAQMQGDLSQALRLCADGFKLDGSNNKALTMDSSGSSTGSIDFRLSSYNNEKPQPGDYKTTVYATIAPN